MTDFRSLLPILTAAWLLAWTTPNLAHGADAVSFQGSSTVRPIVEHACALFRTKHPEVRFTLDADGTSRGILAVAAGQVSIGMTSRRLRDEERLRFPGLREFLIGTDGIAVVVHPDNPVRSLTREQLRTIYLGGVRNWKDVDGANIDVTLCVLTATHSTFTTFANYLGVSAAGVGGVVILSGRIGDEHSTMRVRGQPDSQSVLRQVAEDPGALGFLSYSLARSAAETGSVRILALDGVLPSVTTLAAGAYELQRPLLLVTDGRPWGSVADFLSFTQGPAVQSAVERFGYVSVVAR